MTVKTDEARTIELGTIEPNTLEPNLIEPGKNEAATQAPTTRELTTVEPTMLTTIKTMPVAPTIPGSVRLEDTHPKKLSAETIQSKETRSIDDDDRPRTTSETLGVPELTHNQHGHATLLDDPAPLSSLLHLPVLIKEDASST